jgi:hypothetical protein
MKYRQPKDMSGEMTFEILSDDDTVKEYFENEYNDSDNEFIDKEEECSDDEEEFSDDEDECSDDEEEFSDDEDECSDDEEECSDDEEEFSDDEEEEKHSCQMNIIQLRLDAMMKEIDDQEYGGEEINNNKKLLIKHILNRSVARVRTSYKDMSDDEFDDMIENNISDNDDNDDDDYKPPFSDGLNTDVNRHPHCPTILYMYKVYNLETETKYLKVGIARIPEEHCCFNIMTGRRERIRYQPTEEWYVLWDRENAKK